MKSSLRSPFLLVFLLAGIPTLLFARQEAPCPPFAPESNLGNLIIPGSVSEIPFKSIDGRKLYLDTYVREEGERPLIAIIHGGRWHSGSRSAHIGQFLPVLTQAGFNWVTIDYRLFPETDIAGQLEDLSDALDFIRCHDGRFRLDGDQLFLLGEDAGAHLSLMLAAALREGIRGVISLGALLDPGPELSKTALSSPLDFPPSAFPPTLFIHGNRDSEQPLSEVREFCSRQRERGQSCRLWEVEGGIHRAENWRPSQWGYQKTLVDWITDIAGLAPLPSTYEEDLHLVKDLQYGTYLNRKGEPTPLHLDAFLPSGPERSPAVILVHGGGWEAGDKTTYITPLFKPLARADYAWFSINYRLTPDFRNWHQLEDVRRAVRYVRYHADKFGIDPARIAILGESAGGQLVTQVGLEPCAALETASDPVDRVPCSVAGVVSFYGVYDFPAMVEEATPRSLLSRLFDRHQLNKDALEVMKRYSPLYRIDSRLPPFLMINGTGEFLWNQALEMAEALEEAGLDYELIELADAPHGMENWEGRDSWMTYQASLVSWLDRVLR